MRKALSKELKERYDAREMIVFGSRLSRVSGSPFNAMDDIARCQQSEGERLCMDEGMLTSWVGGA